MFLTNFFLRDIDEPFKGILGNSFRGFSPSLDKSCFFYRILQVYSLYLSLHIHIYILLWLLLHILFWSWGFFFCFLFLFLSSHGHWFSFLRALYDKMFFLGFETSSIYRHLVSMMKLFSTSWWSSNQSVKYLKILY